jgi:hypothetical protein
MVAVGTTHALLFQPHHRQESIPPKDVVLEGETASMVTLLSAQTMSLTRCNIASMAVSTSRPI